MDVRMQGNMQYVFHDVCHIQIITYFYGWCTVLETLGPWCLPDKKLVVPREKLERQFKDAVLQSFDDDGRRSIFEELYLPRTYQYLTKFTKHWLLLFLICLDRQGNI
jgi:uncharacterized protein CbrC (UPF0167 family)